MALRTEKPHYFLNNEMNTIYELKYLIKYLDNMVHIVDPSTQRLRQEAHEFEVCLHYIDKHPIKRKEIDKIINKSFPKFHN